MEINGSSWVNDGNASTSIDLYEDVTKSRSNYVQVLKAYSTIFNIENRNDKNCGLWCITTNSHSVKQMHLGLNAMKIIKTQS